MTFSAYACQTSSPTFAGIILPFWSIISFPQGCFQGLLHGGPRLPLQYYLYHHSLTHLHLPYEPEQGFSTVRHRRVTEELSENADSLAQWIRISRPGAVSAIKSTKSLSMSAFFFLWLIINFLWALSVFAWFWYESLEAQHNAHMLLFSWTAQVFWCSSLKSDPKSCDLTFLHFSNIW